MTAIAGTLPRVSVTLDALYYGFYVEGLRRVHGGARWMRPPFSSAKRGLAVELGGRRIYICAEDGPDLDAEALEWCHVYGKVNARAPYPDKVVPIGPSFGITAWDLRASAWAGAAALALGSQRSPHDTAADLWRQWRYRVPEPQLAPEAASHRPTAAPTYVAFAGTIWRNEHETNEARATFLRVVRDHPELIVDGGFAPRRDGAEVGYDDLISPRIDFRTYLERTQRSAFVFNTPAVLGCHGWKLGEFLAMGKAIISTPLRNEMPGPFEPGTHVHVVDPTAESIGEAVELLAQEPYRRHLEHHARAYYIDHLAPEAVIRRLTTAAT